MAADLSINVNGLHFENPFVIASSPPGTNKRTILKAFREGWGGVVAKTVSIDPSKVNNVTPRYGKLYSRETQEVIGFENIELISDRPLDDWLKDFREIKQEAPRGVLIASIMEEYDRNRWQEIVQQIQETGVDAFELNFSCPHGLPERRMGAAMGVNADIVGEVTGWVKEVATVPVWAKMTPNVTDITLPALAAVDAGADGIAAINTILSVIGVDLDTLRPLPTVEGFSTPGGYSSQAVRPIALRQVMQIAQALRRLAKPDVSLSGMGGVQCGTDAAQFILLGAQTVQCCTGPMLQGFKMVHELKTGLSAFMEKHKFASVNEFVGRSLEYFTSHSHLAELKQGRFAANEIARDTDWSGDEISRQTQMITTN